MTYFLAQQDGTAAADRRERHTMTAAEPNKINLCSGPRKLEGYLNIDVAPGADLVLDLERQLLPVADHSVDVLVCMSAINYFSHDRAREIIRDVFRVLKPGGIARFGSQDLRVLGHPLCKPEPGVLLREAPRRARPLSRQHLRRQAQRVFLRLLLRRQTLPVRVRLESLRELFLQAGFSLVEERRYRESRLRCCADRQPARADVLP